MSAAFTAACVAARTPSAEERRRSERPVPGSRQERILLAKWTRSKAACGAACWRAAQCCQPDPFPLYDFKHPHAVPQGTKRACLVRPAGLSTNRTACLFDCLRTTKRLDPWWSQTGSNRRPHACKARALPTELWPHGDETTAIRSRMVGLGRLERPTSPLSGVRSNHLSYRPHPRNPEDKPKRAQARHPDHALSVNEKRETKTAASRITGSD